MSDLANFFVKLYVLGISFAALYALYKVNTLTYEISMLQDFVLAITGG